MIDGGLRALFKQHLPTWDWQAIEVGAVGKGVPDVNFCAPGGHEGWIECKLASANAVGLTPAQLAWCERRVRVGGRVWLAVRRKSLPGPRRGAARDEIWLFPGRDARSVMIHGLSGANPALCWGGGPAQWPWPEIGDALTDGQWLG